MATCPLVREGAAPAEQDLTREIRIRDSALADIEDIAAWFDRAVTADRFLDAVQATLQRLARHPLSGRRRTFRNRLLRGIRSFRVAGFPDVLVFYRVTDETIDVLRVLHGARDVDPLLG